ncbi:NRAMP family divalent metal transporter [Sporomusa sphaeroides]|uniref:Natural resistance-associated macrophage protein n=1 Tax=Sporomusa sphaeroides DSM 2875 TaxID=1337886 RepID=A0ABP2C532_9FIRM|nr:NRAMP family divalent metal transporter [Sporomusa sphaeroides]OLS55916.1 natural resistance-associated macrophage protein [Sporomusa sphaeroides DSM 2875]CVK18917.1 Natural resistance-associated macrophage protein [Sporomusa sphaeroides DSM 2875]
MAEPVISKPGVSTKTNWSVLLGAAFIMATSAIGPGFLTQTTVFTEKFQANFAFAILASVIIDIGAQLNVWRIIAISRMRGQDVANKVFPGLGHFVAFLIVMGGLAFNIGNIGGTGMALNVLFGMTEQTGAIISCLIAIAIFASKEAGAAMDTVAKVLGGLMILLTTYVMFISNPPVADAVVKSVFPDNYGMLMLPMITLVGGTVGGYITFAGGHRLLDAGIVGQENLKEVNKSAITGIVVTGIMRTILFLAALGVVAGGAVLAKSNPPASVFQHAAGQMGYKFFGIVLWAAAITSVVGCAYTSVSFLRSTFKVIDKYNSYFIMLFILFSTLVFVILGRPVTILVIAGSLNGLILPVTLGVMLLAAYNTKIVGEYKHPLWLLVFGILAVLISVYAGATSLQGIAALWK